MKAPDKPERYVYGPRPLGQLLPALVKPVFRRRSPAGAQVMADWAAIVGPTLAETTAPQRLVSGTLTIACSGPVALELQHLSAALIERINRHVGSGAVQRLRFVQGRPVRTPAPQPPAPDPEAAARAEQAVSGMPPGPLRDALLSLGQAVLTRR